MWVDYKKAPNLMLAEMWKEILEGEGLPVRLLPEGGLLEYSETSAFRVMVPRGREHVADEILRKL
ncbi:MAG: hypothetical protein F4185_08455 [Chloroflexi bacterium]|nr:hypothetical protein [Chloroflexota bacterium]MXW29360.1 hypothetical protein [Chloroflexota bacterium]MXY60068.1 hypothetical protein [Chloroflexota bacterium]MYA51700.1 hypothetical protein [Chloroflexota bacterium]MYB84669.1 hypothetical protein [Chloroflexota bacterium]